MRLLLIFFLIFCLQNVSAAELFGVGLAQASRDQLRNALKQAGAPLVSEAGDDAFFDVYSSGALLAGSSHLYLGFVKKDQSFAFAEYEFRVMRQPLLLQKLSEKYGQPRVKPGKFLTDHQYNWESSGISIVLYPDWENSRSRLAYYHPQKLQQLRQEQKQFLAVSQSEQLPYIEQAY